MFRFVAVINLFAFNSLGGETRIISNSLLSAFIRLHALHTHSPFVIWYWAQDSNLCYLAIIGVRSGARTHDPQFPRSLYSFPYRILSWLRGFPLTYSDKSRAQPYVLAQHIEEVFFSALET